jgi:hypothetical protein
MLEHIFNINFNNDFNVILILMGNNRKTTKFQQSFNISYMCNRK